MERIDTCKYPIQPYFCLHFAASQYPLVCLLISIPRADRFRRQRSTYSLQLYSALLIYNRREQHHYEYLMKRFLLKYIISNWRRILLVPIKVYWSSSPSPPPPASPSCACGLPFQLRWKGSWWILESGFSNSVRTGPPSYILLYAHGPVLWAAYIYSCKTQRVPSFCICNLLLLFTKSTQVHLRNTEFQQAFFPSWIL